MKSQSAPTATSSTFIDLLRERASNQPSERIYTFIVDNEAQAANLTYAALDCRARSIAASLQATVAPGERALLLYPPGLEYIAAFFGCLYAGIIAVPAYPPNPARLERTLPRLLAIAQNAKPAVALTIAPILSIATAMSAQAPAFQTMDWLATDTIGADRAADWHPRDVNNATVAFIQYTSGSTASPKGVMLSHENLLHNSALIAHAFRHTPDSCGVIWLPPYHDMGLIGGILQPLYAGFPVTLMSPVDFLQRPLRWLQAISRYRATTSGGPNFAYDLCARKITPEQRATLDLSSWTVAFNGAEPIRPDTLERFADMFAPCGFRREAFCPCYGLAEATLIVTGGHQATSPITRLFNGANLSQHEVVAAVTTGAHARSLVSCGHVLGDQVIEIVDPETLARCPANTVGEIWVSGPSVARGYWDDPAETARSFHAHIADSCDGPFLRTGDLGFVRDGALFITGRLKDLMIIRGRNYYPQDIELTVERSHPALRPGCGAAFSIEMYGEERPVVVQEIDRQYRDPDIPMLASAIRQAVTEQHELRIHAIVLIKHGSILKTSSGKIQRHACREAFLNGGLDIVESSILDEDMVDSNKLASNSRASIIRDMLSVIEPEARAPQLKAYLQSEVARILRVAVTQVDVRQPLSALGLDSLAAIELKNAIETDIGVVVPLERLLQGCSIAQMAADLLEQPSTDTTTPAIAPVPAHGQPVEHPLSYGQQSLWFLHQVAPESAAHNIAQAMRIRGPLDMAALERAFQVLVHRHEALRTSFWSRDGEPIQQVHSNLAIALQHEDAALWSDSYLNERLIKEAHRPFDLQRAPLLRIILFTQSAQEHTLLLVIHHIVTDFWSLTVLLQELEVLYSAAASGVQDALPPPKRHYTDYVAWQAQMLASPESERLWSYWQRQLVGPLPAILLPSDRPRPSIPTYRGAAHRFRLPTQLSQQLRAFGQAQHATLYMTLLAAFQVLLYRYTDQEDMLVGSPLAGRSRADFAEVVGYFMNPVVMRTNLAGNPSFTLLLDRVRHTVLAALEHQDYPAHLLAERLQPARNRHHSSLFQVMFILNRPHRLETSSASFFEIGKSAARLTLGDLDLSPMLIEQQAVQFDLTLMMVEAAESLSASLHYNADLFDATTMARLADHFQTLLASIVADPEQRIRELPLITDTERRQLLVEWNGARRGYPQHVCIHHLVEAQVLRTPAACAIADGQGQLSYHELNQRANQLAHYLQHLGVGPEVRVALCMDRSPDLLVGMLGVLKAGGAYVPLDPTYPQERLSLIVQEAQIAVLLIQQRLAPRLQLTAPAVVCLDTEWDVIAQQRAENPSSRVTPHNLAYIIYTSGSTGAPKGVAIQHGSLVSYTETASRAYAITPRDRVLQFASVSFDTSAEEIYPCLTNGATLVLRTDAMLISIAAFVQQSQEWGITVWNLPTAYWHDLTVGMAQAAPTLPPTLRLVIIGGERARPDCYTAWLRLAGHQVQLVNTYGPTEATIVATMANLLADVEGDPSSSEVPIGRAIDNSQVYVLDRSLQPVPTGIPGQLYIGGAGLARGYLDRAALTAERFVPNPFTSDDPHVGPGARLYATGDLVRYRAHGMLEFLGRLDDQVKIRGYRVELGEIEAVLNQHAAVRTSVVVAQELEPGDRRLVAYLVPRTPAPSQAADSVGNGWVASLDLQTVVPEVRRFVQERLPPYMVPAAFAVLEALPLLPNGKVDRRALPAANWHRSVSGEAFVAPRTLVEELIAGIWAELLGVEQIGVNDNFFELGGHSLLAIRLIARLRDTLQFELPLLSLFEMPTVAKLAEHVTQANQPTNSAEAASIRPVPRDQLLPLSFSQEHIWFLDKLDPDSASYYVPRAIKFIGPLDVGLIEQTFSELVRRHEILRTTFPEVDGRPVQVIHAPQPISIPIVDLRSLDATEREAEVQRRIAAEGQQPFDIDHGPLLRLSLLQLDDEAHTLLLTEHHLIHDGWTQGVLIREFIQIYTAFANQQPSPLPEPPIQFVDFACWQREWLQGAILESQLTYWKQQLAGAPPVLDLPLDRSRPAVRSSRGAEQIFVVSEQLAATLRALSRREGCTLFMTMVAVFKVLLYRYSGQEDILVGAPIANRRWCETEGMLGMVINSVVLRTDLSGNPTFRTLLQRVRTVCLGAYAHQDLPFEKVVEALQPTRSLSYNPLFQVMFGFQDTPTPELELPKLTLQLLDSHNRSSKFDLNVTVLPRAEQLIGQSTPPEASEIVVHVEYNTDIFNHDSIERLLGHFQVLLASIVEDPGQPIRDLPLITEAERQQLVVAWNVTTTPYPRDRCLHELVVEQAERTPDAVALVCADQQLTYRALDQRANQLAHELQRLGVGPEVRVGVCLERSVELVVALLAILKAGGAYVPLDPSYPHERLQFILEDSAVSVALTATTDHRRLTEVEARRQADDSDRGLLVSRSAGLPVSAALLGGRWSVVDLVADWPTIAQQPTTNPDVDVAPDNLAYVIYTSGSTGMPKGAGCCHAGVVNLLADFTRRQPLAAGDACSCWTSISFDVSVYEIWSALLAGGVLHLVPDQVRASGRDFIAWLQAQQIRSAYIPPFFLHDLEEWLGRASAPLSLRRLLVGVEPIPEPLLASVSTRLPGLRIINGYGPTEATICATLYDVQPNSSADRNTPIGRPVQNTQLYLLDRHLQPVPVGVPGELYIGGDGLARGYLNRPELTAERFVPNPFATTDNQQPTTDNTDQSPGSCLRSPISSSSRLYRTGDLARYRADGQLEFVGRLDYQVKVRGFRIELGEIETVLAQHPDVCQAVVVAREVAPDDKRLVAYITQHPGSTPPVGKLRDFLLEFLPDYMVPSAFICLEALPLTPNGKLDRRALPVPDWTTLIPEQTYVAPRTPFEELLTGICSQVLGIKRVGVYDNFFELGGHSLLATQLIARVREAFQVELPLRSLFEAGTVAELAQQIELLQRSGQHPQMLPLRHVPRDNALPASFAQQRLWFLDQLGLDRSLYNVAGAVHITGMLNIAALEQAINAVIRRHEALRMTFTSVDGRPFQRIAPDLALNLPVVDLRGLPADEREDHARQLAEVEARQPFDLSRGPLLRCALLLLDTHEQVLLLTTHHIIVDGWSIGVLRHDLAMLYEAYQGSENQETVHHSDVEAPSENHEHPQLKLKTQNGELAKLPIQYADFAHWQRQWMQGAILENRLNYWKERLGGISILELPTDHPRPAVQSSRGACRRLTLPQPLTAALRVLSRQEGVTLFMTLLAAFQTLLARYSGQDDILVGTPVANRTLAETEGLIGLFVNTLVLRTDLSGKPTFRDLLKRVREVTLGAYAHQEVPFERLVEELQPERNLSHTPLFQVMFVLQNVPTPAIDLAGLTWNLMDVDTGTTKFDLTLSLEDTERGIRGELRYSTDLFEAATIDRMIRHFQILLESIATHPNQRIANVPLLPEEERQLLLATWNATQTDYPIDPCLHHLFEAQVARTPDACAVMDADQQLTYAELDAHANELARHLRALGVGSEVIVGICMERSVELLIALLGVLKAGGAYLPLDPSYPQERLRFMLRDTRAPVVITQATMVERVRALLVENVGAPLPALLCLDHQEVRTENRKGALHHAPTRTVRAYGNTPLSQNSSVAPDNPAYVIYTSGSTGQPKGVLITHRAICNHMHWMASAFALTSADRVLQKTPISFDASVWEFYAPLLAGGLLVLARPDGHRDTAYLIQTIATRQITVLQVVPSLLRMLLEEPDLERCRTLRRVFCGGEELPAELTHRFGARLNAQIINLYGPTEATIDATYWACEPARAHWRVPIGRPIDNMYAYVLDAHLQPVPIGVTGELYIGGAGLARGYLGRPDLTAERFVPNPFATTDNRQPTTDNTDQSPGSCLRSPVSSSSRLYRTGDLARYRADGQLEFVGRRDHQVKLRGHRIELGEIEALLMSHPMVSTSVVDIREDSPGDKRLVAYVVPIEGQGSGVRDEDLSTSPRSPIPGPRSLIPELRAFLKEKMPESMVPSAFVVLKALPMTPNGKLDRQALAALDSVRLDRGIAFVPPGTPVEELLANIWAAVLGHPQIGIHDNFFSLGGHSLLATQVIWRIRDVFQVDLPVRSLFEAPTMAGLAEQVAAARAKRQDAPQPPPITPLPRDRDHALPLSFAQQRLWVLTQFRPGSTNYNIPLAVRLRGPLVVDALQHSLNAIVQRHETLRTTFATVMGQPVQIIAPTLRIPLPVIDLEPVVAANQAVAIERLMAAEAQHVFDLEQGPLLRAGLLRLEACEHILLLTMHHIISDGWSIGILVREMAALYEAYQGVEGRDRESERQAASNSKLKTQNVDLSELPIQYADFAVWEREWLSDAVLEKQLTYWRQQLAGLPTLALSTDRPRPAAPSGEGARLPFSVDEELSARLKDLSQKEGVTLFMTVLATFQVLLFRYTGQEDIVVGTDIANRNRAETEGLIGFFTNQVVLRTDLSGQPCFRELLVRVRETTLGAYAHQDLSFERLVQKLNPPRSPGVTPLFQVKIVFQDDPIPNVPLAGLEMELLKVPAGVAKFDLTLFLWTTPHGLAGSLEYDTDLFASTTITRMLGHFKSLLSSVVAQPDARLSALEMLSEDERKQRIMEQNMRERGRPPSFKNIKPKAVAMPQGELVTTDVLWPGEMLPLVIQPMANDVDLVDWAKTMREDIEAALLKHGAILFRGFGVDSVPTFERFALTLCSDLFRENGEHMPVTSNGTVQTPVFFPPDKQLLWHNENSFNHSWPMKIFFGCAQPAHRGGETPLVDSRKVFELIDPQIREQFMQKQVMYIRNYGNGLGLTWQQVFQTTSKAEVEQRCRAAKLMFEWKDGDRLKTYCVRPAVTKHPKTGELSWFNQAQHWHIAGLDPATRDSLLSMFGEEDLPRHCRYGDGSPIEDSVMVEILGVYRSLEKSFPWQKGDVVLLDNMLTAHGRNPFMGERKILVALGAMSSYDEL